MRRDLDRHRRRLTNSMARSMALRQGRQRESSEGGGRCSCGRRRPLIAFHWDPLSTSYRILRSIQKQVFMLGLADVAGTGMEVVSFVGPS